MNPEKKTACLISCSDHYGHRLFAADACLKTLGYETVYITSDFDHTKKQTFSCSVPGSVQLHARPYRKNLSAARILSHRAFARDVFAYLDAQKTQPDVLVVLLPPNYMAQFAAKYKARHPQVTLIFDIFDLWPETFPFGRMKKLLALPFRIWAGIRDGSLGAADFTITECDLFRQRLHLEEARSATVYLCAPPLTAAPVPVVLREDALDLCYVGAINNIIDIPAICSLIAALVPKKPVTLHIIGGGERQQELIDRAGEAGAQVEFYGPVYADEKKQEILSHCHFGLNIMKSSVCVGLTMKSVDYFRFGLPIINRIPADTERLIQTYGAGIPFSDPDRIASCSVPELMKMRENTRTLFRERFSQDVILGQYLHLFTEIL